MYGIDWRLCFNFRPLIVRRFNDLVSCVVLNNEVASRKSQVSKEKIESRMNLELWRNLKLMTSG